MHYYLIQPLTYTGSSSEGFTYQSNSELALGNIVTVPLGRKTSHGVVVQKTTKPKFATKPITHVIDQPALPRHLLDLAQWLVSYYASSPSSVWQTILPAGLATKRRAAKLSDGFKIPKPEHTPTAKQAKAIKQIQTGSHSTYLLQGITGSGKTRVYLELARQTLAAGKNVIVLVPEIALTPQIVAGFQAEFGDIVIATHSRLTPAQRHQAWLEALGSVTPRIAIGPRSALFMPLKNIGLVVVDECHETSYKQEQNPRYQAVVAAGQLAKLTGAKLVLGSATPGLFELYLAKESRIGLVKLTERINQIPAPDALVVDLRDKTLLRHSQLFSQPLVKALTETLSLGRQSLLFINRRGSASSLICSDCGIVQTCPNCQIPLTFHADLVKLRCHYCNFTATPPAMCPECGCANLRYLGGGTKRIEAEIARLLPTARLARLDKDSFTPKYLEEVYRGLHNGEIDILIGTQMIAKGLDLPRIDTVGVVSADTMLHIPDFTASERTFQLLTQVSGRSGRGDRAGKVVIQTYSPSHPAITAAAGADYWGFTSSELELRRLLSYPPFTYLMKITSSGKTTIAAQTTSKMVADQIIGKSVQVLGPAPSMPEVQAGKYRWHVIVKAAKRSDLLSIVKSLPKEAVIDLDPINLL